MNESLWSRPSSSNNKQGNLWISRPRITKPREKPLQNPGEFRSKRPNVFFAGALWCLPKCGFKGGHTKTHHRFTNRDVQWWKISKSSMLSTNRWHKLHTQMRGKSNTPFQVPADSLGLGLSWLLPLLLAFQAGLLSAPPLAPTFKIIQMTPSV